MDNKKNEDKQYIYFIEVHKKGAKMKLYIQDNDKYKFLSPLKKEAIYDINNIENCLFEVNIYSFIIFFSKVNEKKNKTIKVILEEENKNKFESKIDIQDIERDKDYFIFNFKFESSKLLILDKLCQSSFRLPDSEIFNYYANFIRNVLYENQDSKKNADLMYYARKKLIEKKNYNYYFFANILIESFKNKSLFLELFQLYKKDKFETKDIFINVGKMEEIKRDMNAITEYIEILFGYAKDEIDENILKSNIISFIFYFNYYYQKEQVNRMAEIKEINSYVFDIISKNKFEDLFLTKNAINELFKNIKNFDNLHELFYYNNNMLDLLEVIDEKKSDIIRFYLLGIVNKKNKIIKINEFIVPQKNDKLEEIFYHIKEIISFELKNNTFFIYFSENILNEYIEINENNLNNIIIIYQMANYIKENDCNSSIKNINKILNIMHNQGIYLIEDNKLSNFDILLYLENDESYTNIDNQEQFFNILQNINVTNINSDFIFKWKKINWKNMYHDKKDVFYKIIFNNIKDIKYLENIFILSENDIYSQKEFIVNLVETFERLYPTYNPDTCKKTAGDIIKLHYFCEMNNIDSSPIFNCIKDNNILKSDIFNELINKKKNKHSEIIINKLFNYSSDNSECSNLYYYLLLYIIQNSKTLKSETILYLNNNYSLSKDDFFNLIENDKLKIYKELLNNNFIEKGALAASNYLDIIKQIDNELKNGTIKFYYINNFYSENKEDILYERLLMIAKNNKSIADEYKNYLDKHMKRINNILKDDIIYNYLNTFFPDSQKNNINILKEIKQDIFDKNLIFYQTKEKDYLEIKNQFIKDATENLKYINNKAFMSIYNILKNENKNENKNLLESREFIDILTKILEENGTKNIDDNDLKKFINILINSKKDLKDLVEDITLIISEFNINTKLDATKISEDLLLLSQSDKYLSIIDAIINFINLTEGIKTYFYSVLNNIYKNLSESKNNNVIKLTRELLKGYKIDIDEKYIDILIKLKNREEETNFLFDKQYHTGFFLEKLKNINNENNNSFFGFEKTILFIDKFISNNNGKQWKDKEIISEFKNNISNNEEIYSNFENYFDQYKIFKENFL